MRATRGGVTTRNWATIRKLDAMMGASGAQPRRAPHATPAQNGIW